MKKELFNKALIRQLIAMKECIDVMKRAFTAVATGKTATLQRAIRPAKNYNLLAGIPALNEQAHICGSKIIVFLQA